MSTLIIPCAGESSRYPDGKPKCIYSSKRQINSSNVS